MPAPWQSYDTAAASHHQLAVPRMFAPPARDLVARMNLDGAARILDVGTGTGIAASMAVAATQGRATVIGVDPSIGMLRTARETGVAHVAVATLPNLPFPDAGFDGVMASFVLSHIADCPQALREMVRILRPGGRLGATAWGAKSNPYRDLWDQLCQSAVDRAHLQAAVREALPWEDRLTEPRTFERTLSDAGLASVEVHSVDYRIHMTIADFLAIRFESLQARFVRQTLGGEGWTRFAESVTARFHECFQDPIDHTRDALLATGTRPS